MVYKYAYSPQVYEDLNGVITPIKDAKEFESKGYKWSDIQTKKGELWKDASGAIYEYHPETKQKVHIPNWDAFIRAGYSAQDVNTALPAETAPYAKLIEDWYKMKPATPPTFKYSPEEEAAAKTTVGQEYRPFYQEQATQGGEEFKKALTAARSGFSRRGLWGAAGAPTTTIDPNTGLEMVSGTAPAPAGGPVSGLRQTGEQQLGEAQTKQNTAFGRAYTEAVAGGVQGRKAEAQNVWQTTIQDPYKTAYQDWLAQLNVLQAKQNLR